MTDSHQLKFVVPITHRSPNPEHIQIIIMFKNTANLTYINVKDYTLYLGSVRDILNLNVYFILRRPLF